MYYKYATEILLALIFMFNNIVQDGLCKSSNLFPQILMSQNNYQISLALLALFIFLVTFCCVSRNMYVHLIKQLVNVKRL